MLQISTVDKSILFCSRCSLHTLGRSQPPFGSQVLGCALGPTTDLVFGLFNSSELCLFKKKFLHYFIFYLFRGHNALSLEVWRLL